MSDFDADPSLEGQLSPRGGELIVWAGQGIATPTLFAASPQSARRFWEFFTAEIPNDNTRKAYFCAIRRFDAWCAARNLSLLRLQPILIAAYVKELQASLSVPSVKQHLAAIRMLFDYLVVGQVLPMNPAASVRGPKYVIKKGKTPVLSADEARHLIESIETTTGERFAGPRAAGGHGLHLCPRRRRDRDAGRGLFPAGQALVVPLPRKGRETS